MIKALKNFQYSGEMSLKQAEAMAEAINGLIENPEQRFKEAANRPKGTHPHLSETGEILNIENGRWVEGVWYWRVPPPLGRGEVAAQAWAMRIEREALELPYMLKI